MIGDHHQLPPVIKNMAFQKYSNMEQSLFTRFVRLGVPTVDLDAQGRARARLVSLAGSSARGSLWVVSLLSAATWNGKWLLCLPCCPAACATCTTGATNIWGTCLMCRNCLNSRSPILVWHLTTNWLMWRTLTEWVNLNPILISTRWVVCVHTGHEHAQCHFYTFFFTQKRALVPPEQYPFLVPTPLNLLLCTASCIFKLYYILMI